MKNDTLLLLAVAVGGYLLYKRYTVSAGQPAASGLQASGVATLPGLASTGVQSPNTGGIDVLPSAPRLSFSSINDL